MTTLNAKDSEKLLKKMTEDLKKPVGLVPTPKLEIVRKMIFKKIRENYNES